jgi:hypothetical protein
MAFVREQKLNYTAQWFDVLAATRWKISAAGAAASVPDRCDANLYPTFTECAVGAASWTCTKPFIHKGLRHFDSPKFG